MTPPPQLSLDDLEKHGFPRKVALAFLDTAATTRCVVLTRVPGGATTDLIEEGYDLKSYFIKAKSCDWGPMSGFICTVLHFNKNGAAGVRYNAEHLDNYSGHFPGPSSGNSTAKSDPAVPLKVSAARMTTLAGDFIKREYLTAAATSGATLGLAWDKDKSVVTEFIVQPADANKTLYALYFGRVWALAVGPKVAGKQTYEGPYAEQHAIDMKVTLTDGKRAEELGIDAHALEALSGKYPGWKGEALPGPPTLGNLFYPIKGLRNPAPPYEGDLAYKNAVSGDYDLFAVWPIRPASRDVIDFRDLVRVSEDPARLKPPKAAKDPDTAVTYWPIFTPLVEKGFALRSLNKDHIYVEFVPGFEQIKNLEDDRKGNISGAVEAVAGTLNSAVYARFSSPTDGGTKYAANAAFHSDEGGRPGVTDIEYPIAMFVPAALEASEPTLLMDTTSGLPARTPEPILIENDMDFAAALAAVESRCWVLLHYAWLAQLANSTGNGSASSNYVRDLLLPESQAKQPREAAFQNLAKTLADQVKLDPPDVSTAIKAVAGLTMPGATQGVATAPPAHSAGA